ncbi:TetR family transcriptional regulator [Cohnella sp. REN36]|uniref:TetR/AcrR family transcriptional regulator n=1 Tax=Cohnella sp. REN36 TaxID=2887347 RepID=UPI001D146B97|nr:TetR/AcrR family transcriptional regulator [Cohnella sp. REN36]
MRKPDATEVKESRDAAYRRRILSAAARLLEQNGIESVNMYQIAQEAGIGQGTLYRRYEHPGEIYAEILQKGADEALNEMEQEMKRIEERAEGAPSALEGLMLALRRTIDYIDDQAELLVTISCMYGKKNLFPQKRPISIRLRGILNGYLKMAAAGGEVRDDVDVTLTTSFMLTTLYPEQYLYHRDTHGYDKDQYLSGIRRLFIEGIRAVR